ncbi:TIGR04351 family putative TOMM peptide [Microtetraspora malaysiensis]|uniref:TIGR04351 family putative TOMM peptide n=1 Tax=Microtetraspora malaysiensis TaxID=161358 RepID=A0ABW6SIR1_9ACTN
MAESIYVLGDEDRRKFARLMAAAWADQDVKDRYGRDPRAVLSEYGIAYPEGVATPPLPDRPAGDFDVEELEAAAGGTLGSASSVSSVAGTALTAWTVGSGGS